MLLYYCLCLLLDLCQAFGPPPDLRKLGPPPKPPWLKDNNLGCQNGDVILLTTGATTQSFISSNTEAAFTDGSAAFTNLGASPTTSRTGSSSITPTTQSSTESITRTKLHTFTGPSIRDNVRTSPDGPSTRTSVQTSTGLSTRTSLQTSSGLSTRISVQKSTGLTTQTNMASARTNSVNSTTFPPSSSDPFDLSMNSTLDPKLGASSDHDDTNSGNWSLTVLILVVLISVVLVVVIIIFILCYKTRFKLRVNPILPEDFNFLYNYRVKGKRWIDPDKIIGPPPPQHSQSKPVYQISGSDLQLEHAHSMEGGLHIADSREKLITKAGLNIPKTEYSPSMSSSGIGLSQGSQVDLTDDQNDVMSRSNGSGDTDHHLPILNALQNGHGSRMGQLVMDMMVKLPDVSRGGKSTLQPLDKPKRKRSRKSESHVDIIQMDPLEKLPPIVCEAIVHVPDSGAVREKTRKEIERRKSREAKRHSREERRKKSQEVGQSVPENLAQIHARYDENGKRRTSRNEKETKA